MNYAEPVIVGEVNENEKLPENALFHLVDEKGKPVAECFFSDTVADNLCFNVEKNYFSRLVKENAYLRMIQQKGNVVAFAVENLKNGAVPAVTAWNA